MKFSVIIRYFYQLVQVGLGYRIATLLLGICVPFQAYAVSLCVERVAANPPLHHRVMGININPADPHITYSNPRSSDSIKMTQNSALIWNVQKHIKGLRWARDFHALAENSDLILLQEVTHTIRSHAQFLGRNFSFGASWEQTGKYKTGVATISRSRIHNPEFTTTENVERMFATPKSAMVTYHSIEGSRYKLMAVNLHSLNLTALGPFEVQLKSLAVRVAQHIGPVIFAGDMNTWKPARLALARSILESEMVGLKFKEFQRPGEVMVLDHVFTRGLINVRAAILPDIKTSDHKPIILYYDINSVYLTN